MSLRKHHLQALSNQRASRSHTVTHSKDLLRPRRTGNEVWLVRNRRQTRMLSLWLSLRGTACSQRSSVAKRSLPHHLREAHVLGVATGTDTREQSLDDGLLHDDEALICWFWSF